MFRIAVCDDDREMCAWLEEVLGAYGKSSGLALETESFFSGESLCKRLEQGERFQLIFLDIELKSLNGVETGRFIRKTLKDEKVQLLYISGKAGYAMELFQNRPLNFFVKPLDRGKVVEAVEYAVSLCGKPEEFFEYRLGQALRRIPCSKIMYFQSEGKKVRIHAAEGAEEFYGKLSEVSGQLCSGLFLTVHKSYLVNRLYIASYRYEEITLLNGEKIPISQPYRKTIRGILFKQKMEGKGNGLR